MAIGTWAAITNGSDPNGNISLDSGSSRKFVLIRGFEAASVLTPTYSIGTVAPTQMIRHTNQTSDPVTHIDVAIWDETDIGTRVDDDIDVVDGGTISAKQSWSTVTVTDVGQSDLAASDYYEDGNTGIQSVSLSVDSNASDILIGASIDISANRGVHQHDGLSQRAEYSASQYSFMISDGPGGGALSAGTTLRNDEAQNSQFGGILLKFAPASAGDPVVDDISEAEYAHGVDIDITGSGFESAQGTGSVVISPTDDVTDVNAVTQTVNTWQDDQVSITLVRDTLDLRTPLFLFVENDTGDSNSPGFPITLQANRTLNFFQPVFLKFTATLTRRVP